MNNTNMIFFRKYKRLSGQDVSKEVKKYFEEIESPLNEYQIEKLESDWGNNVGMYGDLNLPFQAYSWEKVEYKGNTFVRLTFPIFLILIILLSFVIRPIHWLFTGSWWFKEKWGIEKFLYKWWIKISGE